MTTSEQQSNPQELFKDLAARMADLGVPVGVLLRAAEAERQKGDAGAQLELEPDEHGPGAIIAVRSDVVDVKVGGEQFALDLDGVRQEYMPEPQNEPPVQPEA